MVVTGLEIFTVNRRFANGRPGLECRAGIFRKPGLGLPAERILDTSVGPQSYSVKFPKAGNYKFSCFVHFDMTGAVHVLDPTEQIPYEQTFYNREALIGFRVTF